MRTPARRIAFAIVLSLLMHVAILWLPYLHLPHDNMQLPPLSIRLEPLPKPAEKALAESSPARPVALPGDGLLPGLAAEAAGAMKEMTKSPTTESLKFPKHLRLVFASYKEGRIFKSGEVSQQLDIHKGRYALRSLQQAAGLSGMQLVRTSYGEIGERGLRPEIFEEEKITPGGKQKLEARFDWGAQILRFSAGRETALPDDTQDILSFMYQLSQISMQQESFPLPITDGARLEPLQVEIGAAENISTPMGDLRALHLRKRHNQGEPYFEIWLGLEYRLLPVKFRQIDVSGNVVDEFAISDIRASDE